MSIAAIVASQLLLRRSRKSFTARALEREKLKEERHEAKKTPALNEEEMIESLEASAFYEGEDDKYYGDF